MGPDRAKYLVIAIALAASCSGPCTCSTPASAEAPEPTVAAVTSSTVELRWPGVVGARHVRVLLSAEPWTQNGGPLPDPKRLATLDGHATSYHVEDLPPGTTAFLRVEADTPHGLEAANVMARTPGGPRAQLDSPVRQVAALGPRVLRIVLEGGNPRVWASHEWRIEGRNGHPIPVRAVHRESLPISQRGYEIGFGKDDDLSRVTVDHRIYLELGADLGSRDVLTIHGPDDLRADRSLQRSLHRDAGHPAQPGRLQPARHEALGVRVGVDGGRGWHVPRGLPGPRPSGPRPGRPDRAAPRRHRRSRHPPARGDGLGRGRARRRD